jgi:hypothetical protein
MKLILASTLIASASAAAFNTSYLDKLPTNTAPTGGGVGGYLDFLPASPAAPTSGSGIGSYLDSFGGGSAAAPTLVAASPAPAAVAPAPVAAAPAPVSR